MKKRNIIIGLALTVMLGSGVTSYAKAEGETFSATSGKSEVERITSMNGEDYIANILKSKLGLSDEEITAALDSGKSLYDLAIEKGLTKVDLKAALLEEKTKAIDIAVSEGKITKDEGAKLKEEIKKKMENCREGHGKNGENIRKEKGEHCK